MNKRPEAEPPQEPIALQRSALPLSASFPGGGGRTAQQLAIAMALGPAISSPQHAHSPLSRRILRRAPPQAVRAQSTVKPEK